MILPTGVLQTGYGIFLGHTASEVPQLTQRRGQQFNLVQGIDVPPFGCLLLDSRWKAHVLNIKPNVNTHITEKETREILVRLFAVDNTEIA